MSDAIDLSAPEVRKAIDTAVEAAVEKATAPLLAKRDELLGEVKKLRKQTDIDPAELERVESERDDLKAQLSEANKAAKTAAKTAEDATKRAEVAEMSTTKLLIDNGMSEALAKAGVTNPVHQKAARAMLVGQAQVITEGDSRVVKVGDKALGEFITEWAGSDEGKFFVTAPETSGSGSQGSGRPSETKGDMSGDKAARTAAIAARLAAARE